MSTAKQTSQASRGYSARLSGKLKIEKSWVIPGSFSDHDGIARAGEYVRRTPGSMHATHSAEGCGILAIDRTPNIFRSSGGFNQGSTRIKTDRPPTTFATSQ